MWYDASIAGHPADSGFSCLAVATAATLTPTSPVFTDTSSGSPWCPAGGVLDPSPFVDPTSHVPYLVWKTNDGSSAAASQVWGVPLSADGTAFAGSPSLLLTVNATEGTTDNPQLVTSGGAYSLLFSGGNFDNSSYNEQLATCAGPLGPCANPAGPFLTSYGGAYGPGGGSIFQDASGHQWLAFAAWNNPCSNCTSNLVANQRQLYIASTDLAPVTPSFTFTGMAATPSGDGYWLVDSSGGVHPHGGGRPYGSMAGAVLNAPVNHLVPTPTGRGYWMVAADGGIFSFGDARFFGSMGGRHLNAPVVDLAPTPDGGGYWLVAADGGIFAFGDAPFFGSMGGQPPQPSRGGDVRRPEGPGVLDGGIRRGHLRLRLRRVLRLDGRPQPESSGQRHGVDPEGRRVLAGGVRRRHLRLRRRPVPGIDGGLAARRAGHGHGDRSGRRGLLDGRCRWGRVLLRGALLRIALTATGSASALVIHAQRWLPR